MLGDIPVIVDWLGGAVVGLLVAGLGKVILDLITDREALARLIAGVAGIAVGAGSVIALQQDDTSPEDEPLEVLVVWNGSELSAFLEVVSLYGPEVKVDSAGPGIADRLDDLFDEGDPPDVAIIPQPSVVERLASQGRIEPIDDAVVGRMAPAWTPFLRGQHGSGLEDEYGVFVKAAHKSLFWYHPDAFPAGATTPENWSWSDFADWARNDGDGAAFDAPLTVAVNDEWPLTDWFENHLAALDPELYDRLAEGDTVEWDQPVVRDALRQIADLWQSDGMFDGGPAEVTNVELEDMVPELEAHDAALMFAPSFVAGAVRRLEPEDQPRPFGYPRVEGRRPQVVGGDIAVVTSGSRGGHRFVDWLTNETALRAWAERDPGFLTPNTSSPYRLDAYPPPDDDDAVHVLLTSLLTNVPEDELHFDLSDEFGGVNDGRPCIFWRIFSNFFHTVTVPGATEEAIDAAVNDVITNLNAESQGLETNVTCD